jgi:hypothetical protein
MPRKWEAFLCVHVFVLEILLHYDSTNSSLVHVGFRWREPRLRTFKLGLRITDCLLGRLACVEDSETHWRRTDVIVQVYKHVRRPTDRVASTCFPISRNRNVHSELATVTQRSSCPCPQRRRPRPRLRARSEPQVARPLATTSREETASSGSTTAAQTPEAYSTSSR